MVSGTVPSLDLYGMLGGIGDEFASAAKANRERALLSDLGAQIGGGDYLGAARKAFGAGALNQGLKLLELNNEREKLRRQQAIDNDVMRGIWGGASAPTSSPVVDQLGAGSRGKVNLSSSDVAALAQTASRLGTKPEDLATVIGYETGGTFNPSIMGGKGGNYLGLIQFGPSERAQFGARAGQTFQEQLPAVEGFLRARGFRPGMGLADLYSTINAGSPGHYNASDRPGYTVSRHVEEMSHGPHATLARSLFGGASPRPEGGFSEISGKLSDLPAISDADAYAQSLGYPNAAAGRAAGAAWENSPAPVLTPQQSPPMPSRRPSDAYRGLTMGELEDRIKAETPPAPLRGYADSDPTQALRQSILASAPKSPLRQFAVDGQQPDIPLPPRRPANLVEGRSAAPPRVIPAPADVPRAAVTAPPGGRPAAPPGTHWAIGPGEPLLLRDDMDARTAGGGGNPLAAFGGLFGLGGQRPQAQVPTQQRVQVASADPRFVPQATASGPAPIPASAPATLATTLAEAQAVRDAAAKQRADLAAIPGSPIAPPASVPVQTSQADTSEPASPNAKRIEMLQGEIDRIDQALQQPVSSDLRQRLTAARAGREHALTRLQQADDRRIARQDKLDAREEARLNREETRNAPPSDVKEYEYAKKNGFEGSFMEYQRAKRPNTTVNVGGGSDKQIFDSLEESRKSAASAVTGLRSLQEAKKAIDAGGIFGAGADYRLGLAKIASFFGADPTQVQNTETFRSVIAPQVASLMKATVGSTQISNADREFAEKAAGGNINLDPGSIKRLLGIMEKASIVTINDHRRRLDEVYPQDETNTYRRERALFGVPDPAEVIGQQRPPQPQQLQPAPAPILDEARAALAKRPDKRDAILQRLQENGYDASGL